MSPGHSKGLLLCGPKWLNSLARKRQCFGTLNPGISGREEVGFAGHSPLRVGPSHSDTHNSEIRPSGGVFSRQPWTHRTRCEMGPGSIRQDRGAGTSGDCAGLIFPFLLPARSGLKPESRRSSSTAEAVRFPRPRGPTTMKPGQPDVDRSGSLSCCTAVFSSAAAVFSMNASSDSGFRASTATNDNPARAATAARADRTARSASRENGRSGASGARIPPHPAGCENDPETREGKAKPKGRAGSCGRAGTVEYPARGRLRSTRLVSCPATSR